VSTWWPPSPCPAPPTTRSFHPASIAGPGDFVGPTTPARARPAPCRPRTPGRRGPWWS
jgi:hypothetical protein